jgi:hypothetical protein
MSGAAVIPLLTVPCSATLLALLISCVIRLRGCAVCAASVTVNVTITASIITQMLSHFFEPLTDTPLPSQTPFTLMLGPSRKNLLTDAKLNSDRLALTERPTP